MERGQAWTILRDTWAWNVFDFSTDDLDVPVEPARFLVELIERTVDKLGAWCLSGQDSLTGLNNLRILWRAGKTRVYMFLRFILTHYEL